MIRSERLRLRPWRDNDGDALAQLLSDPQVMADVGGPVDRQASDRRLAEFQATYQRLGFCKWAVEHDGTFIGYCGVMPGAPDHPLGDHHEIGWRLLPSFWGHGFATEAARAALDHALGSVGLLEVLAFTAGDNVRSQAVVSKLGLRRDPARDFTMVYEGLGNWRGLVWVASGANTEQM